MSLSARLQPNNTLAAQTTARNAFARFLSDEGMTQEEAHGAIVRTTGGLGLAVIMDKFAIFLAFGEGTRGAKLATNTVNRYYGNVKLWLLSQYPQYRLVTERELQVVGARLSKYCKKRSGGQVVRKAPACRKQDLHGLLSCMYKHDTAPSGYLDGLLINWLWYLFGRSSDLAGVQVSNISIYPGGALYVCFTRQKTADECGLTLFRDLDSFVTCPINALAVALAMKSGKDSLLFDQLPGNLDQTDDDNELLSISLRDLLASQHDGTGVRVAIAEKPLARISGVSSPAVHSYVNRLMAALNKRDPSLGVRDGLTSHSFRRGGAQHANGNANLSPQWILDRGAWSMSATNKGFVYVMNTTREDQQVAKQLSGWGVQDTVVHVDLSAFDGVVVSKIREVAFVLFSGCDGICAQLLDVLMATILLNYPGMANLQANPNGGIIARIHQCLEFSGVSVSQFLAWNVFLAAQYDTMKAVHAPQPTQVSASRQHVEKDAQHQRSGHDSSSEMAFARLEQMMAQILQQNRILGERVSTLERLIEDKDHASPPSVVPPTTSQRSRKAASKSLRAVWIEWRSGLPPRWTATSPLSKQEKHEYKFAVAYMSVFLVEGYTLDSASPSFASDIQRFGDVAQARVLDFLRRNGIDAKSLGTIVKAMRDLYRHGILDNLLSAHAALIRDGRISDHLPAGLQAVCVLPLTQLAT